jgi:hypothetical protein
MALDRPPMNTLWQPGTTDRRESAMEATNNNDGPDLSRVFAPMLSELEDHATRLIARQSELARELAAVDEELARVESVRAAMLGKATPRGPGRPRKAPGESTSRKQTRERAERIIQYARTRPGEEFTGREAADAMGISWQGVGPTLAGMARRGELAVRDDDGGQRLYRLV